MFQTSNQMVNRVNKLRNITGENHPVGFAILWLIKIDIQLQLVIVSQFLHYGTGWGPIVS